MKIINFRNITHFGQPLRCKGWRGISKESYDPMLLVDSKALNPMWRRLIYSALIRLSTKKEIPIDWILNTL